MSSAEASLRRISVWSLFALSGLFAIVGVNPGATLFFLLIACTAAVTNHLTDPAHETSPARSRREPGLPGGASKLLSQDPPLPSTSDWGAMPRGSALPSPEALALWTDEAICQAWRRSYVRLRRLSNDPECCAGLAAVALERACYLDELERRHPVGFTAWLTAGARAPSDPSRYLGLRASPRPRESDA